MDSGKYINLKIGNGLSFEYLFRSVPTVSIHYAGINPSELKTLEDKIDEQLIEMKSPFWLFSKFTFAKVLAYTTIPFLLIAIIIASFFKTGVLHDQLNSFIPENSLLGYYLIFGAIASIGFTGKMEKFYKRLLFPDVIFLIGNFKERMNHLIRNRKIIAWVFGLFVSALIGLWVK